MAVCNNVEWDIIQYRADVNRFENPSIETDTDGFTASSSALARDDAEAYVGAYSLKATANAGAVFGWRSTQALSVTIGETYTFQAWINGVDGVNYRLIVYDVYPGTVNDTADFTGTGDWQQVYLTFTAGATSETYEIRTTAATTGSFYTDAIEVRDNRADTYIDGDQLGCLWDGRPHASSSRYVLNTRAGGQLYDIEDTYKFKISSESGSGTIAPDYKELDRPNRAGSQSTGIKVPARVWQLSGIFDADDWEDLRTARNDLQDAMGNYSASFVNSAPQQFYMQYTGDQKTLRIGSRYDGGLDNTLGANSRYTNMAAIRLLSNENPYWFEVPQDGAEIDGDDNVNRYGVLRRADGIWSDADAGSITGTAEVYAICVGADGDVYVGGAFTQIDGVANTAYVARYSPLTGEWSDMDGGLNATVWALQPLPDGRIAVGGEFTNADGDADADYVALYDPSTDDWDDLNSNPLDDFVYGLDLDPSTGDLIIVGAFTQDAVPTTLDRVARYDFKGGANNFEAVGSVTPGVDNTAYSVGVRSNGQIIVAGTQTEKISAWDVGGTAFYEVGVNGGANDTGWVVFVDLVTDTVYVGGAFTSFDGETVGRIIQISSLSSTYVQWEALGGGFADGQVQAIARRLNGEIWVGGTFSTHNDLDRLGTQYIWTGSQWVNPSLAISITGARETYALAVALNGDEYWGGDSGAATTQVTGDVTITLPDGAAATYPTFEFLREGIQSGTWTLLHIENYTTGSVLRFDDLELLIGEIIRINCQTGELWSNIGRNLDQFLLDGKPEDFYLQAGDNLILVLLEDNTAATYEARAFWYTNYESLDAAEDSD